MLSAESDELCGWLVLSIALGAEFGHGVFGEVVALGGPVVVLFGEHGADEADDRVVVGEDPDHVGAAFDLSVESFQVEVGPGRGALFRRSVSPARPPNRTCAFPRIRLSTGSCRLVTRRFRSWCCSTARRCSSPGSGSG